MPTQYARSADGKTWYQNDGSGWTIAKGQGVAMTNPDRTALNKLQEQATAADETQRLYVQTKGALSKFKTGPFRGAFMDAILPDEKGGFWDKVGAAVGAPLVALGAVSPQDINAFQTLKARQQERVGTRQLEQKGVQTESDAARFMLADVSPYKVPEANADIMAVGGAKAARGKGRANFAIQWANRYGLNGVDGQGRSMEQAFQQTLATQPAQQASGGWTVKRIGK